MEEHGLSPPIDLDKEHDLSRSRVPDQILEGYLDADTSQPSQVVLEIRWFCFEIAACHLLFGF